jgi:hypothetical protein
MPAQNECQTTGFELKSFKFSYLCLHGDGGRRGDGSRDADLQLPGVVLVLSICFEN